MIKSIQTKIILIFFIIGIIIIGALSFLNINSLKQIETANTEINTIIAEKTSQTLLIMAIAIGVFAIITVLVGYFIHKAIVKPIDNLIENAEKIANGEEVEFKEQNKNQTQISELSNAFNLMTNELKQNLNEVARQKRQIETILLHMTDGIIAFDMEGNIIHINPAAIQLLNLTDEKNTFNSIFTKFNTDINLEKIVYLENWTSSEQRLNIGEKYINLLFAPFQDESDKPEGVIVVIQDITEHVKLDNMRKEFVADVSHELKTPIALIQGYAEGLIENVNSDEESRKFYAEVILDETNKMDKLVKQLLELMKLEYGKREFDNEKFNINELINEVLRKCSVMINEKNIKVYFENKEPIYVYADEFYMDQIITNYLTNAIKHAEEVEKENKIEIKVEKVSNKIRVSVFNTGENIPEEDLQRIWGRFYKLDSSRNRQDGGSGIGLALVKAIMNNYQNEYGVENKKNGVEFYFDMDISD